VSKTASGLSLRQLKGNPGAQLAAAKDLPEVLDFVDLAAAAKALAQTHEQKLYAEEWHLRGQRKAGELLTASPIGRGRKSVTLADFAVDQDDSKRWQAVAAVPEDAFEAYVEFGRSDGGDITRAGLLRYSRLRPLMSDVLAMARAASCCYDPEWHCDTCGVHLDNPYKDCRECRPASVVVA